MVVGGKVDLLLTRLRLELKLCNKFQFPTMPATGQKVCGGGAVVVWWWCGGVVA